MTTSTRTQKQTMMFGYVIVTLLVACSPIKGTAVTHPCASAHISSNTETGIIEKIDKTEEEKSLDGTFYYTGSPIVIPRVGYSKIGSLDTTNIQSFDVFGNLLFAVAQKSVYKVYDINTFEVLKTGILPHIETTKVHGNMCSFGNEVLEGSSIPVLYVSHWDGDKGVVVYSISSADLTAKQVQKIIPSEELKSSSVFGIGNTDFIVDAENGFLYSVCYKENKYTEVESNKTCICKYLLPKVSEDSTIILSLQDIIESFEIENIATRQDACIKNGIMYISNGYMNPYIKPTLRAIDLNQKAVVSRLDLRNIIDQEPEGVAIINGGIIVSFWAMHDVWELKFDL